MKTKYRTMNSTYNTTVMHFNNVQSNMPLRENKLQEVRIVHIIITTFTPIFYMVPLIVKTFTAVEREHKGVVTDVLSTFSVIFENVQTFF